MIIELDPLKHFEKAQPNRLVDAAGLIPYFAIESLQKHPEGTAREVYDEMVRLYGFGDYEFGGEGQVHDDGLYVYPGDPELPPIMTLYFPGSSVEVLIYQHAIIAVRDSDETIVSRMD